MLNIKKGIFSLRSTMNFWTGLSSRFKGYQSIRSKTIGRETAIGFAMSAKAKKRILKGNHLDRLGVGNEV